MEHTIPTVNELPRIYEGTNWRYATQQDIVNLRCEIRLVKETEERRGKNFDKNIAFHKKQMRKEWPKISKKMAESSSMVEGLCTQRQLTHLLIIKAKYLALIDW
jgi:hypothetical protein